MKKLLVFFAFLFLLLPQPVSARVVAPERINLFTSEITINQDTSLSIKETTNYFTPVQKHGIFRYIPYRYQREGFSYTARIKDVKVTDEAGLSLPFEQTKKASNIFLKIGDPDKTFSGSQTYVISYTVEDALKRFEEHDELYWDITGEGWQIPIRISTAQVSSPFASITKIDCFTGPVGSDDGLCGDSFAPHQADFVYHQIIDYNDNFTIVLALDPNSQIIFPSAWQRLVKWAQDNFLFLLLPLPGLLMFFLWFKKGRDWVFDSPNVFNLDEGQPKHLKPVFERHRVPMVYEPIKGLTPGEAGVILDEKVDDQDVVAEILDLARKRYLKIKPTKGRKKDFLFTKLKSRS